jgi:hypothetical protein
MLHTIFMIAIQKSFKRTSRIFSVNAYMLVVPNLNMKRDFRLNFCALWLI